MKKINNMKKFNPDKKNAKPKFYKNKDNTAFLFVMPTFHFDIFMENEEQLSITFIKEKNFKPYKGHKVKIVSGKLFKRSLHKSMEFLKPYIETFNFHTTH